MLSKLKKLYLLFDSKDHKKLFLLMFLMIISSLLETLGIGAVPGFVIIASNPEKLQAYPVIVEILNFFKLHTQKEIIIFGAIALILVFVAKNIYLTIFNYYKIRFVFNRQASLECKLFERYLFAPYVFHLKNNSSSLLRNVTTEVQILTLRLIIPSLQMMMDIIMVGAIFILLMFVEPMITLVTIGFMIFFNFIFLKYTNRKIKEFGKDVQYQRGSKIKIVNEGLGGIKDVKVLHKENYFYNAFKVSAKRTSNSHHYSQFISTLPKPYIETLAVVSLLLITLILIVQERSLVSIIPILALFGSASVKLMPAIRDITKGYSNFRYNLFVVDPIYDDIKKINVEKESRKKGSLGFDFRSNIEIKALSVRYEGQVSNAVDNVDASIVKGEIVAFVGASGAGKSTLVDTLLGLIKPESGDILVDGESILNRIPSWQKIIGYVPQNIYLIDDTIKGNVCFGIPKQEIDEKQLYQSLGDSQLLDFIRTLPEGINSLIGERGARLSGGQRQRIGIARALYHKPALLILDEATSALDNVTEKHVMDAIEKFRGKITIIIIAHRISTVVRADKIFLFDNGKIIDSGNYMSLLTNNNTFKKLVLAE